MSQRRREGVKDFWNQERERIISGERTTTVSYTHLARNLVMGLAVGAACIALAVFLPGIGTVAAGARFGAGMGAISEKDVYKRQLWRINRTHFIRSGRRIGEAYGRRITKEN